MSSTLKIFNLLVFVLSPIIAPLFGQVEDNEKTRRFSVDVYQKNLPLRIWLSYDREEDSLYFEVSTNDARVKTSLIVWHKLPIQKKYLDSFPETEKLFKFLNRRILHTSLFKKSHLIFSLSNMTRINEPTKDTIYYELLLDQHEGSIVTLVHQSCCQKKWAYIFKNWPWQVIPTWRLYNKITKSSREIMKEVETR